MDELFEKMREYVKMEEEISTEEFIEYYQKLMNKLQVDYEDMDQEKLLKYKLLTAIVAGNSASRKGRKQSDSKKYKKINEKSLFWSNAIEYRLKQMGMTMAEIERQVDELETAM